MNRHIHADKIIAKAENMDLVVLVKHGTKSNPNWLVTNDKNSINFPIWDKDSDYFLCHEEHTEACLHWLNGGEVEVFHDNRWLKVSLSYVEWTPDSFFMNSKASIRIKPKKEKRWIGVYGNHVTNGMYPTKELCERCVSRSAKFKHCASEGWQFIEIEVEV